MDSFIHKYQKDVVGVIKGFDRIRFRGTLRWIANTIGLNSYLQRVGCRYSAFKDYAMKLTERVKEASLEQAHSTGRPVIYLPSTNISKELTAKEIAERDGIRDGLICVLTCVEPCMTPSIRRISKEEVDFRFEERKCLHLYHYFMHPTFGFMHGAIQSWLPLTIKISLNGREWLGRMMDDEGIGYERRKNCFTWIEDVEGAQRLMDSILKTPWPRALNEVAAQLNPAHENIFAQFHPMNYYWSADSSEWATDFMFSTTESLDRIYPYLAQGAINSFSSDDVMRYLADKELHALFKGQVVSTYKRREEGLCVRHRVNSNSVKMYNKEGSVFRVESTINQTRAFKVFRSKEGEPKGQKSWQKMRKGVADLYRRAQVSDQINNRYIAALASLDTDARLKEIVAPVCTRTRWKKQSVRGLKPWSTEDRNLLEVINRGEFNLTGFRNRDLVPHLYADIENISPKEKKRRSAAVTRRIRMLRAHGIIHKIRSSHRYRISKKGREILTAILASQEVTLDQLNRAAA